MSLQEVPLRFENGGALAQDAAGLAAQTEMAKLPVMASPKGAAPLGDDDNNTGEKYETGEEYTK